MSSAMHATSLGPLAILELETTAKVYGGKDRGQWQMVFSCL